MCDAIEIGLLEVEGRSEGGSEKGAITNPCQYPLGRHYPRYPRPTPVLTVCMFNTRSRVSPVPARASRLASHQPTGRVCRRCGLLRPSGPILSHWYTHGVAYCVSSEPPQVRSVVAGPPRNARIVRNRNTRKRQIDCG